jgi:DNA replication regulator SLD2
LIGEAALLIATTTAQKYKDYNRTRDILNGRAVSQAPSSPVSKTTTRKRKHDTIPAQTPSKRLAVTSTPSKSIQHPANVDPYDSPSLIRNLFTPSQNRFLGPTPQKDGQVLGLFDLLSNQDEDSPLKGTVAITGPNGEPQATPRKATNGGENEPGTMRHSRTPASSGKRFMLDSFATPLKLHSTNERGGKTPLSVSKLHFSTPSFLRRDSQRTTMPPIEETEDGVMVSPQMVRLPKKPLVRGLSSILAGLRKMEEEAADDDLDALREMEGGPPPIGKPAHKPINKGTVLVEDSQVTGLLGGFDDEAMYDSEPEELRNPTLGRDGQPLKIWKKKGQKRTTRRTNMKPVRSKPSSGSAQITPLTEEALEAAATADDEEAVPETQQEGLYAADAGNFDSDSASEYTASEGGTRYRRPNQERRKKTRGEETKEGTVKTAARKVGAIAHANFKRLKLRNSGAKGGVAHNSRFRRKR